MRWTKKPLAEVTDFCLGKMLDGKKNRGDLLPYLANINVRWGEFDLEGLREMRFEHDELDRYGLRHGDIVMCEGGEPGRCAIWKEALPGMMFQKALHRIRPNDCLEHRFLFYCFLYKGKIGSFASLFTGSTIKHLPREKLAKLEIEFPQLEVQRRIADLLSMYDDLIDNNRRRIRLLEEAARLLFREWFVHFRFPGHEHVKITKCVPEGWTMEPLSRRANAVMGQSPPSKFYNESGQGLPFHQGVKDYGDRFPSHRVFCTRLDRLAQPGDILFSVRAPVGRINIARDKLVIGRGLAALRASDGHQTMLHYQLRAHFHKEDMIGTGAIYAAVKKNDLFGVPLLKPPVPLVEDFESIARGIDRQIEVLTVQTWKLAEARSLLLPKLMSGELEV